MGVEGGTRFIPEAALGCQGTSCFLLNAFQLGWLQAWGGQVIYSNTQWNRSAGTWTQGFATCPGQSTFCFLLSASSLNCTQQPAGCVWCSPSSQLSPLRTGRRGMLQVKSQCSGSAASGKLLHACSKHTVSGESQNEDSYTHTPRLEKEKLSSHFSFACWFFFPFLFFPFFFLFFLKEGIPLFTSWNPKCTSGQFAILWPMNICGPGCSLGIGSARAVSQSCPSQKGILGWVEQSGSEEACEWSGPRCPLVLVFQGHVCTQLQLVLWAAFDFIFWHGSTWNISQEAEDDFSFCL